MWIDSRNVVCYLLICCSFCQACTHSEDRPAQPVNKDKAASHDSPKSTAASSQKSARASSQVAAQFMQQQRFDQAFREATQVLIDTPNDPLALLVVGAVTWERGDQENAIRTLDSIPDTDPQITRIAQGMSAQWQIMRGDWLASEAKLRSIVEQNPKDLAAQRDLVETLHRQSRRYEALAPLYSLISNRSIDQGLLLALLDLRQPLLRGDALAELKKSYPNNSSIDIAVAYEAIFREDYDLAIEQLSALKTDAEPGSIIQSYLAYCFAKTSKFDLAASALRKVPLSERKTPLVWIAEGLLHDELEAHESSAACYAQALGVYNGDSEAWVALARSLSKLDSKLSVSDYVNAAIQTKQLMQIIGESGDKPPITAIEQLVAQLTKLGRHQEATAWANLYRLSITPGNSDSRTAEFQWRPQLVVDVASRYREMNYSTLAIDNAENSIAVPLSNPGKISLINVANEKGLSFVHDQSAATAQGLKMYQSFGGGVGVIDINLDGWQDLVFPKGEGDPRVTSATRLTGVFLNRNGNDWSDVSEARLVGDDAWGVGIAAGDYNADGFPDLLMANLGVNTLWCNQGDGTFQKIDVPSFAAASDSATTSAAIADVTADGLPDLICINYASVEDMHQRVCATDQGRKGVCAPTEYASQNDLLLVNLGQGEFADAKLIANASQSDGRGFGVLVGDFDGKPGNDFFVANDMNANTLFLRDADASDYSFVDDATARGLAFDNKGTPQASMGMAHGDFDRDGRIDFFITNFFDEVNVVYCAKKDGSFVDRSRRFGFHAVNKQTLGFGTQANDLDRDGWLDLVVLNGHIDDFRYKGLPYAMLPEVFAGTSKEFKKISNQQLDNYFQEAAVGRVLSTIDWNNDLRMDFLATHLDRPVALLENHSEGGNCLQLQLIGTDSDRDATGAVVVVEAGDDRWTNQLIRGSGFSCSNQAVLDFGIGEHQIIDRLIIHWPNGKRQTFESLDVNQRYLIIEDQASYSLFSISDE